MKFAFVFPGQGSQSVGMLNVFSGWPVVQETLAQASDILEQDIGALIANGPADALNLTFNTQPAMLTAAYAVYRAWRAAGGPEPAMVAGHSLGEYTALVAAGALAFDDALKLVRFRAQIMQEAVPEGAGSMAAILGLDAQSVRALCTAVSALGTVEAVNFNAPTQTVIAGQRNPVETVCKLALSAGAQRAVPLPVSAPFHSSLLKPAADRLSAYLSHVEIRAPRIPVVNNIDVAIASTPQEIRDALARQVAGPVRWVECVRRLVLEGATQIIECGPGKVLTGLTKRIDRSLGHAAIHDPASLESAQLNDQSDAESAFKTAEIKSSR
ncbi:malonyl-CoA-(acyl-carrier-protein) transacylase [Candidatus Glomeribacter gigasporarum BEG34]|uniref:Malonyl CoA-acyl carrier protein transacylase n=1 Tax=Candidatus Glomeribacter gigasporarum BEG34 TaxID=1070319 RepID=G2J7M7_9BURK|nr:ACP S-malonyltransferase [Candidatus Glomeribacter gigasporarum]CCD28772.1 malonyl-CoA-(acyl-carrier-protein) transacylase [Candidatus Glomeribacter gigasporarum BEG34]